MAKKSDEKMLSILTIKEMHIQNMLRFHLIPVRIATIKKTNNDKCS
jgi:hypothetical protein